MHIQRTKRGDMELGEMDFLCSTLILQLVPSAIASDSPAAQQRLYSSPTENREPEFDQDWRDYVEPDLRDLFRSTREIVEGDLKDFAPDPSQESATLRVPKKHLEAWIHTLNQARLAISARFDFTEEDMENLISRGDDVRGFALFQVHFYGFLQECFLQQLD